MLMKVKLSNSKLCQLTNGYQCWVVLRIRDRYPPFTNPNKVESLITKHVPIIKHFPIFSSFINQIEQFLCRWTCKLKGLQIFFEHEKSKGAMQKTHEERMSYSLFCVFFLKNKSSRPLSVCLSPAPYLPHFQFVLSDLKPDDASTRALQNLFVFQRQRCNDQRFLV